MTTMRTMMYRDDFDKNEMLDHAYEIKKAACKIIETLEGDEEMSERNRYRDRMNYRRDMRMRDDYEERNSRYGY